MSLHSYQMRKYSLIFLLVASSLVSCHRAPHAEVSGTIDGAAGEVLYIEQTALVKTTALDSCVLGRDGAFRFRVPALSYPELYRLRIGGSSLPLVIDSTEHIVVTTTLDSLSYTQDIVGSATSLQIAQLRAAARVMDREQLRALSQEVIVRDPRSMVAYYALFMKQGGVNVWDIYDVQDRRMYQAVATSFHTWMPDYVRSKSLYGQVLDVINGERSARNQETMRQFVENAENAFLDITLADENGRLQTLSDRRGHVIVLDFSAIEMEQSKGYIFELRSLYNAYHERGLEIYSVSLDRNKLLWEQSVENIPWTTVRVSDEEYSSVLTLYNVQSLPTLFLFDKQGNIQGRFTDFEQLDTAIQRYL